MFESKELDVIYRLATLAFCVACIPLPPCIAQPPTPSFDQLLTALEASSESDKIAAAAQLAEIGDEATKAIPALVKTLNASSPDARAAAIIALGHIGSDDEAVIAGLLERLNDEALRSDDVPVWAFAARALGQLGPKSVPRLIAKLSAENRTGRRGAAVALHDIKPPPTEALPALVILLKQNEPTTRIAAMYAILQLGPRLAITAMPELQMMLGCDDFHTQYWSCRVIGAIGQPEALVAVPKLVDLTAAGVASVRVNAADAIGSIGPTVGAAVVAPLTKALRDRNYAVRRSAVIALGRLGSIAAPSVAEVTQAMNDKSRSIRAESAATLWQITGKHEISLPVLIEVLQERNAPWEAALAFKRLGSAGQPAVAAISNLVETTTGETQYFAVLSLAGIGTSANDAISSLEQLRQSEDPDLRETVETVIETLSGK